MVREKKERKVNKNLDYHVCMTQKYQKLVTKSWTLYYIDDLLMERKIILNRNR